MPKTTNPRTQHLADVTRALAATTAEVMVAQVQEGAIADHTARLHTMTISGALHGIAEAIEHDVDPQNLALDYVSAIAKCNTILVGLLIMGTGQNPDTSPDTGRALDALLEDVATMSRAAMQDTVARAAD